MQDQIESCLAGLIGLAMIGSNRAVDMEMFSFDRDDHREFTLHVQCPWRIERSGRLVVGYQDMRDPPIGVPGEGFDPNEVGFTRRDELLRDFFAERQIRPRRVVEVAADNTGQVRIVLDDASALQIFPDSTALDDEYWRLLGPDGVHYVVGGEGFELMPARESTPP